MDITLSMIFGGRAGAPITSHFRKKTMEIIRFSMISGLGRGPGTSHLPKKNRNHDVFNNFGDGLGIPITPRRAKKLLFASNVWFSGSPCTFIFTRTTQPPVPPKRSCETSKWASGVRRPDFGPSNLVPNLVPTLCQVWRYY